MNKRSQFQNLASFERYNALRFRGRCTCPLTKHGSCYAYQSLTTGMIPAEMHRIAERASRIAAAKAFIAAAATCPSILS